MRLAPDSFEAHFFAGRCARAQGLHARYLVDDFAAGVRRELRKLGVEVERARADGRAAGHGPEHLELEAVGVLRVEALGRAVAGLAGVGVQLRQGRARLLQVVDGVDLPRQVVETDRPAPPRRLGTRSPRGTCSEGSRSGPKRWAHPSIL